MLTTLIVAFSLAVSAAITTPPSTPVAGSTTVTTSAAVDFNGSGPPG